MTLDGTVSTRVSTATFVRLLGVAFGLLLLWALRDIILLLFLSMILAAAIVGFKRSLWLVAAALAAHGVFDLFHGHLVDNPGVPRWWPHFCLAYDVVAAAYLALLLARSNVQTAVS